MSNVRENDREDTDLKALSKTRKLCRHTMTKCKSMPVPKRERWLLPDKMRSEALDACVCVARANKIYIGKGVNLESNYAQRHALQVEAHTHVAAVLELMEMLKDCYGAGVGGMEYWTGLATESMKYIKSWADSDTNRYLGLVAGP